MNQAGEGKGTKGGLLLVEDNEADVIFFKRAVARTKSEVALEVVMNGVDAVQHLSGNGPYGDRQRHPLPSILVLDLKLPRMSGLEVLEWMSSQPALHGVRTIVLTSSPEESDVRRAYALGAVCYVVKPVESAALQEVVQSIVGYWADPGTGQAPLARHAVSIEAHQ
ncbi:MAG TPA: response regulator [Planctomycetota bacterium]|nr:response regulator [Planctomycetota bacterium]